MLLQTSITTLIINTIPTIVNNIKAGQNPLSLPFIVFHQEQNPGILQNVGILNCMFRLYFGLLRQL